MRTTILVPVRNDYESMALMRSLKSIGRSNRFDIVVVDDTHSKQNHQRIRQTVADFAQSKDIKIYRRNVRTSELETLYQAYTRSKKAARIVIIRASHELSGSAQMSGTDQFHVEGEQMVIFSSRARDSLPLEFVIVSWREQLQSSYYKLYVLLGIPVRVNDLAGFGVTPQTLRRLRNKRRIGASLISPMLQSRGGREHSTAGGYVTTLMFAVSFSGVIAYAVILALSVHILEPLLLIWLAITIWRIFGAITDDGMSMKQKLLQLYAAPTAMFVLPVSELLRCLCLPIRTIFTRIKHILHFMWKFSYNFT